MTARTLLAAALGCAVVLSLGCSKRNGAKPNGGTIDAKPNGEPIADAPRVGPLESLREDARLDPSARHFALFELIRFDGRYQLADVDGPLLATAIHRGHVEEFVRLPSVGVGRTRPEWPVPNTAWVELVAASPGERSSGKGDGKVWYSPFTETLNSQDGARSPRRERVWLLADRQLVSANAITGPAVYLRSPRSQHDLMKLKPSGVIADKVPLDVFETEALKKLRAGDEVALRSDDRELRMLGAIRARKECLSCHDGGVGALLGAFTYTLTVQAEDTSDAHRLKDLTGLTDSQRAAVRAIEAVGGKVLRGSDGRIAEVRMTFSRNQEIAAKPNIPSTRLPLRDSALPHLLEFPDLTVLDLSDSLVTGVGLKTVGALRNLKRLDLRFTFTTEEGIAALRKALPGCEIVTTR